MSGRMIGGWIGSIRYFGELVSELSKADVGRVCIGVLRRYRAAHHKSRQGREEGEQECLSVRCRAFGVSYHLMTDIIVEA